MHGDIKVGGFRRRRSRIEVMLRAFGTYAFALVLLALAVSLGMAASKMYGRMAMASEGEDAALHQLEQAQAEQAQVDSDLQNLATPRGVEGELRQRYGVAKPGEGVIKIVSAAQATSTSPQSSDSIFVRIWHIFFP